MDSFGGKQKIVGEAGKEKETDNNLKSLDVSQRDESNDEGVIGERLERGRGTAWHRIGGDARKSGKVRTKRKDGG